MQGSRAGAINKMQSWVVATGKWSKLSVVPMSSPSPAGLAGRLCTTRSSAQLSPEQDELRSPNSSMFLGIPLISGPEPGQLYHT